MNFTKPSRLVEGDTVALISPSWGAPSIYPDIFERGVKELENLGLKTKEFPTARMNAEMLYENPMLRAEDVVQAFADPDVKAIVTSIGGDDSVRILDHVDWGIIQKNPKIFMGFSDTTTLLVALNMGGLVTFHGPSIMAGLAQINAFPPRRPNGESTSKQCCSSIRLSKCTKNFVNTQKAIQIGLISRSLERFYQRGRLLARGAGFKENVPSKGDCLADVLKFLSF